METIEDGREVEGEEDGDSDYSGGSVLCGGGVRVYLYGKLQKPM